MLELGAEEAIPPVLSRLLKAQRSNTLRKVRDESLALLLERVLKN